MTPHGLRTVALISLLVAGPLIAQQGLTRLSGVVTDPQGRVLVSAKVVITNASNRTVRETTTGGDGTFVFPSLSPDVYNMKVNHQGFAPYENTAIEVPIQTPTTVNVSMAVTATAETVSVSGQASPLNTTDATIGNTFTSWQITQLPLEGRNVAALLSLQPGVAYTSDNNVILRTNFGEADADQRNGAVNGSRSDQANVTLDGIDVNDQQTGFAFNSAVRSMTEAVSEFRVVTANSNADQGRSSGAQISMSTRSGSNGFHGAGFESHRNTLTSANSWFNNRIGAVRPKLIRNVFGASLGGPVMRDTLFFFGAYEGRRDASETPVLKNVPTSLLRAGSVRYRDRNGQIVTLSPGRVTEIDPLHIGPNRLALETLSLFPLPNDTPTLDPLNFGGYRFNSPFREQQNAATLRLDYIASDAHNLFVRGNMQNDSATSPLEFPNTVPPTATRNTSKALAAGLNSVLSPSLINSFRHGLTRLALDELGTTTGPRFSFGGGIGTPFPLTHSRGRVMPVHNFVNDVSWASGSHNVQFGINLRLIQNDRYNYESNRVLLVTQQSRLANLGLEIAPADIATNNQNDFVRAAIIVLGVVSQGNSADNYDRNGNLLPLGTPVRRAFRTRETEWYAQDSWRVRSNVTLTYGVRYSLYSPIAERNGSQVTPDVRVSEWARLRAENAAAGTPSSALSPISFLLAGPENGRSSFYDWDLNNVAPRLAAAWSPSSSTGWLGKVTGGPGKTSIRMGAGVVYDRVGTASTVFYDSIGSFGLYNSLVNPAGQLTVATAPRFQGLGVVPPGVVPDPVPFGFPQTYPRAPRGSVGAIIPAPDTTLRTPYSALYNVSWQRELPAGLTAEVAYVGRRAYSQLALFDSAQPVNLRDPQSGVFFYDAANQLINAGPHAWSSIARSPYWENLFPGLSVTAADFTRAYPSFPQLNPGIDPQTRLTPTQAAYFLFGQANPNNPLNALQAIDVRCSPACSRFGPYAFYNDQFASLFSWRSIGTSAYDSMQVMVRKHFVAGTQFDLNYTLSKSTDWVSGAERGDAFGGSYVINSWAPEQMEAPSDFDLRHQLNFNGIAELPLGRGRPWLSGISRGWDALVGGWQLAGILRSSSGFPVTVQNGLGFSSNHYFRGFGRPIGGLPETRTNKNEPGGPNLFSNPQSAAASFGAPQAGESGERNNLRGDGLFTLDLGLSKSFTMPRLESHRLAIRWEVFNVTNSVRFNTRSLSLTTGAAGFGTYSAALGTARVMQFLARYSF